MLVNDEQMKLDVWYTAELQDFDFLRPLSYPEANVFLVCVSVASAASFHNVSAKWGQPPTHPAQPPCNAAQLLARANCASRLKISPKVDTRASLICMSSALAPTLEGLLEKKLELEQELAQLERQIFDSTWKKVRSSAMCSRDGRDS